MLVGGKRCGQFGLSGRPRLLTHLRCQAPLKSPSVRLEQFRQVPRADKQSQAHRTPKPRSPHFQKLPPSAVSSTMLGTDGLALAFGLLSETLNILPEHLANLHKFFANNPHLAFFP